VDVAAVKVVDAVGFSSQTINNCDSLTLWDFSFSTHVCKYVFHVSELDDIIPDGKFDHIHGSFQVQLLHDMILMGFYGAYAQKKLIGYLLIGKAVAP
jgi:hypothetical protein